MLGQLIGQLGLGQPLIRLPGLLGGGPLGALDLPLLLLGDLLSLGGLLLGQLLGVAGLRGGDIGDRVDLVGDDAAEPLGLLTHGAGQGGDQSAHRVARSRFRSTACWTYSK